MRCNQEFFYLSFNDEINDDYMIANNIRYDRVRDFCGVEIGSKTNRYYINGKTLLIVDMRTYRCLNKKPHISHPKKCKNPQVRIVLNSYGKQVYASFPRMIAMHLYPDVKGRVVVLFKDGNRLNIEPDNLQLVNSDYFASKCHKKPITYSTINGLNMVDTEYPNLKLDMSDFKNVNVFKTNKNEYVTVHKDRAGYRYIMYKQKLLYIHVLVFHTFFTSEIQDEDCVVDHIDCDFNNNNPENLQLVPRQVNSSFFYT